MERRKASDFPPEVLKLFDGYVHGRMSRREFLDSAARYAVGGFSAVAMLEALQPNFAWAQQVKVDDARIATQRVDYPSPKGSGTMRGYLAKPAHDTYATHFPDLNAAVPYYGVQPKAEEVAKIKSPILAHYASEDERITSGWPAYDKALSEHHVDHAGYIYPNTQHGFHNDTTPRYDEAAAKLSWQRTLAFFQRHVKS